MEKRRLGLALVVCATLFGVASVTTADEPAPAASQHARKKKKSSKKKSKKKDSGDMGDKKGDMDKK